MLTPAFWRKYFEEYDLLNELIPYQELMDAIVKHADIGSGDSVLDLGSGTGNVSMKIEELGGKVTAMDFSKEGIEIHRNKSAKVELIHGDITEPLPFPDQNFDVLVSNNVLYTIPREKRDSIAKEMYRVLKPGGRVVISNVAEGFKPHLIYWDHIKTSIRTKGVFHTLYKVITLIIPTIKIFYYNHKINKEHATGSYDFFRTGEQAVLLTKAGFKDVSPDLRIYSDQAVLNWGRR